MFKQVNMIYFYNVYNIVFFSAAIMILIVHYTIANMNSWIENPWKCLIQSLKSLKTVKDFYHTACFRRNYVII